MKGCSKSDTKVRKTELSEDEQVKKINHDLKSYHDFLLRNPSLARKARYYVRERGEQDRKRFENSTKFDGTDIETADLLNREAYGWRLSPTSFWSIASHDLTGCSGEAILVGHYIITSGNVLDQNRRKHGREGVSAQAIADELHRRYQPLFQHATVCSTAKRMLSEGSQWLNLESKENIGRGVTFALGNELSPTYWTKITGKSGDRFQKVLKTLRDNKVDELAATFNKLRDRVVQVKMEELGFASPDDSVHKQGPFSMAGMSSTTGYQPYSTGYQIQTTTWSSPTSAPPNQNYQYGSSGIQFSDFGYRHL